jgi:Rad3-related DNA helicase
MIVFCMPIQVPSTAQQSTYPSPLAAPPEEAEAPLVVTSAVLEPEKAEPNMNRKTAPKARAFKTVGSEKSILQANV